MNHYITCYLPDKCDEKQCGDWKQYGACQHDGTLYSHFTRDIADCSCDPNMLTLSMLFIKTIFHVLLYLTC